MKRFRVNIWKDEEYNYKAAYGFVPNLHAFLHDDEAEADEAGEDDSDNKGKNRDCMLIAPGGGYCMCVPPEAAIPVKTFYEQGMNVFVLTYTTDITTTFPLKKQPMEDISRAVRFIRKNAAEYSVEDKKLIACGFSAGAHVVGSLAVHHDDIQDIDPLLKDISNRPDGVILSYPVITTGDYTHSFSVQTLLGPNPTEEELEYFSLEKNVTEKTPPCFIWQTATDDLVPVENSYLMAETLRKQNVPFAHYVFPSGFHGLSVPTEEFFKGKFGGDFGGDYTMEQVMRAATAVKKDEGVEVSQQRVLELKEQFKDAPDFVDEDSMSEVIESKEEQDKESNNEKQEAPWPVDKTLMHDVGLWPELARVWINRL